MKDTTVKFAVITGASKGIGFSVFRELTKRGWHVAGLSRTQGNLPRENWIQCDVTESESVRNAFREALKKSEGRLDALILNAGMGIAGALEFTSEEDYRRQIEVNLTGTAYCAREGAAVMRRNGGGKIIFISSLAAKFLLPFQSFYSAGKAAVNALRRYGVHTDFIVRGGNRVGIYYLESGSAMRPSKVIYDRADSAIAKANSSDFDFDAIMEGADWFHFSGITPAISDSAAELTLIA